MGLGDEILGSGLARGARQRGKRIAFGDGKKILWSNWAPIIYKNNPNVAAPGSEKAKDLEWIEFYKKARQYNRLSDDRRRWIWNYDFKAKPGEFFFDNSEKIAMEKFKFEFIVIEPNVEWHKPVSVNKDWGEKNFQYLADKLIRQGKRIIQFHHKNTRRKLHGVILDIEPDFRSAVAAISKAALYIGPEGGMHHAAAAMDTKAVVLFGGFIPPQVTGYDMHINLTGGAEACGNISACQHCRKAMQNISVDEVYESAMQCL